MDNNHYNKNLKQFARENRKTMTKAEACLWKFLLKNRQLENIKILRQRAVKNYIVDFCSLELKLIIEVDGNTHNFDEVYKADLIRQKELENLGFTVIRFSDEDVLKNIDGVRIKLIEIINKLK
jgi:very-short-patch-repair endonuclease